MNSTTANHLRNSFGPYLSTDNGMVIDVRVQGGSPRLGYNASALFGVLHHPGSWSVSLPESHDLPRTFESRFPDQRAHDYIESELLTQFADVCESIVDESGRRLANIQAKFESVIQTANVAGMTFEMELTDVEHADRFCRALTDQAVLADPANQRKIRFRLNLSFQDAALRDFWDRIEYCLQMDAASTVNRHRLEPVFPESVRQNYAFHLEFLSARIGKANGQTLADWDVARWFASQAPHSQISLRKLDSRSYRTFRTQILDLQSEIYEPARQSPPEEFDSLFEEHRPIGIGLLALERDQIVAMSFAGPLQRFRNESGVDTDPFVEDSSVYYIMDLTVIPKYRGGLGKTMKRAVVREALAMGVSAIHGRNRDRLARGMWAINLSLGAFELQHLVDNYQDDQPFRDCIYYRCPLHWDVSNFPSISDLEDQLPFLINDCCPE